MKTDPRRRLGPSTKHPSDDQAQVALVRAVATVVSERERRMETCMLEFIMVKGIGDLQRKVRMKRKVRIRDPLLFILSLGCGKDDLDLYTPPSSFSTKVCRHNEMLSPQRKYVRNH